jgi:hypothetical protein
MTPEEFGKSTWPTIVMDYSNIDDLDPLGEACLVLETLWRVIDNGESDEIKLCEWDAL